VRPLHVANLTSSVSRQAGGLFESVRHLSQSTSKPGRCEVTVVGLVDEHAAADRPCGAPLEVRPAGEHSSRRALQADLSRWAPLEVRLHAVRGPRRFSYSPRLVAGLGELSPYLVHLHGIWQYPAVAALRWARRTGRPLIVSPHGMLEPWSLQRSKWIKRLAALVYQRACLEKAACIRATSRLEHDSIRQAGYRNQIAVVSNGVELPDLPADTRVCNPKPKRVALFLSRIHPKKGLMNLLRAWASVQNSQPSTLRLLTSSPTTLLTSSSTTLNPQRFDWLLRIVGPDECDHLSELKVETHRLGISKTVQFEGAVYGDARTRCYLGADLFVLPSCSENFGLVIAESLACRVPVITTRATPWAELESARCGWWIETGLDPLVAALRDAISKTPADLAEMGARGRRLIEEKYTWEPIGRRMLEVYEWAAGAGPKPDCVS